MAVNRTPFYLNRGVVTRYLNKNVTTYPGAPTIPQSSTGNRILVGTGNGVGAKLLHGVGPVLVTPIECDEVFISSLGPPTSFAAGAGLTVVPVEYNDPLTSDGFVVFQLGTGVQIPTSSTITGVDMVDMTLNVIASLQLGMYALKIIRASDPNNCFAIRYSAFEVT